MHTNSLIKRLLKIDIERNRFAVVQKHIIPIAVSFNEIIRSPPYLFTMPTEQRASDNLLFNIVIESMCFEDYTEEEILIIKARPMRRDMQRCPLCEKRCPGYDSATKVRRWRSLDFGSQRVYIEAKV
jgi:hypothetical protein